MKNFIIKNWKTSLAGFAGLVTTFLKSKGIIDEETFTLILGLIATIGLLLAKDGDQTGKAE